MIYKKIILEQAPRILGLMDRNPLSNTYGCFDRNYWHYKTSDFPCARMQEAVLTLSYLYKLKRTVFFKNAELLEWIKRGLNFWKNIQNKSGSFDEWYPNENSFVATAFSTYAVTETLLLLDKEIGYSEYIDSVERACRWLSKRKEERAQNQEAGAIMSLYNGYLLTKKREFKEVSEKRLNDMLEAQTREGWFYEYGGPDIGYLSLCVDYLAKYYKKTKDEKVLESLKRALNFLKYFLHPDLTAGGTYGSRNTEYLIPSGFELLSPFDKNAQTISSHIIKSLEKQKMVNAGFLDDRYLLYNGYNYLEAFNNLHKNKKYHPMYRKKFTKDFSQAGLFIRSRKNSYTIVNYKNGGSIKHFQKESARYIDSGIEGRFKGEGIIGDVVESYEKVNDKIKIEGMFRKISEQTLSPKKNILLRLFQLTFGKNESIGEIFREKMRDKLITNREKTNLEFERVVEFDKDKIKITDKVPKEVELTRKGAHSYDFIPSSKYFQYSSLS